MKQTLFMIAATLVGTAGIVLQGPAASVFVYYLFAVLRPQYLWNWALPPDIGWSQYVAVASVVGVIGMTLGFLPISADDHPEYPGLSKVHKAYLLFGIWICLTCFTAQRADVSWPWFIEYLKIFLMFVVGSLAIRTLEQVRTLYLVGTIALVYIAYEVNALYLFQGRLDIYHYGYGGLDNNGAGLMLAVGVPLCIYAWESISRWWRWFFVAAVPVLLHAVLMTYSRGAMVSLLAAVPLLLLRSRRRRQFALLFVALAFVVPVLAGPEIRARFFSVGEYNADASAASRFGSWTAAYRMANDHPLVGVGVRNSNLLSYSYGADMEGRTIHSQYFQILADSGYVGLFLYVTSLGVAWWQLRRTRRTLLGWPETEPHRLLALSLVNGVESGFAVFCVGSSFLSLEVFELPYLLALLAGQLSVLVIRPDDELTPTPVAAEVAA